MKIKKSKVDVCHPTGHGIDYDRITDYVYIGNNMCCQKHFDKDILAKGIRADFSVESERMDNPEGIDYYFWMPVKDHHAPTQKQMIVGSKILKSLVNSKIKTYIHCKLGHGRSPTIVAAYLIMEGMSTDDAVSLLMKKRKCMHLQNQQLKALKRFEEIARKGGDYYGKNL